MKYKLSVYAENDLLDIFSYSLKNFGVIQAQKYYSDINEAFELIGNNPSIGRPREDIDGQTRSFVCQSHVIYYKEQPDFVYVSRILSGSQDPFRNMDRQ